MATKKRSKRSRRRSPRDADTEAVEAKIFDVSEATPYVRMLVYGRNGKGKTRLAASFPKTLIVDVNEEGTRSARQFRGTKVFPVREWDDIAAIYWYLHKGDHPYDTVAIDTLTQLQVLALRKAMQENVDRDPTKDPKQPRRQDWGKSAEMMKDIILKFRNLPMHVVFIAQERTEGDPEEGEIVVHVPDLPAGSRGTAMGAVGIIGRVYQAEVKTKRQGKRKTKWVTAMLVGPHEEYESKDRTGVLGRIVREPSGQKIIDAWEENPGE